MSEQLGFLFLLFVVGTCNLLLGFVLAAHVGRLHLTIHWIAIENIAEQLRGAWQACIGWIASYIPFLPKKALSKAEKELDAASVNESETSEGHAAEETPELSVDYVEVGETTRPTLKLPPAPTPFIMPDPVESAVDEPPPAALETAPAEPEAISVALETPAIAAEVPVTTSDVQVESPTPPSESELPNITRLAAMEEEAVAPPEELQSYQSLESQVEGEVAQLRAEMSKVLNAPARGPRPASPFDGDSGGSSPPISTDSPPSLECAIPDDPTWEDQLQSALQENLDDLKAAARLLQAAEASLKSNS